MIVIGVIGVIGVVSIVSVVGIVGVVVVFGNYRQNIMGELRTLCICECLRLIDWIC